jgi:hypothetical protein
MCTVSMCVGHHSSKITRLGRSILPNTGAPILNFVRNRSPSMGFGVCVPESAAAVEFLFSESRISGDCHCRRVPFAVAVTAGGEKYADGSQRVQIPAADSAFVMTKQ